jgi:hypothetical protein
MKQAFKKLGAIALLTAFLFATVNAQDSSMGKQALKKHHCTAACKNGKHVYAHGEKGHVCTAECKKLEKAPAKKM